jgi:hypothetical protein
VCERSIAAFAIVERAGSALTPAFVAEIRRETVKSRDSSLRETSGTAVAL